MNGVDGKECIQDCEVALLAGLEACPHNSGLVHRRSASNSLKFRHTFSALLSIRLDLLKL